MLNSMFFNAADPNTTTTIIIVVVLVLLLVGLFVSNFFANKKQRKVEADTIGSLKVGDEIETRGGIVGKIIDIRNRTPEIKEIDILSGSTVITIFAEGFYRVITKVDAEVPSTEESTTTNQETQNDFVFGSDATSNADESTEAKSENSEEQTEFVSAPADEKAEESAPDVKAEDTAEEAKVEEKPVEETVATTTEEKPVEETAATSTEEEVKPAAKPAAKKTTTTKKPAAKKTGTSTKSKK